MAVNKNKIETVKEKIIEAEAEAAEKVREIIREIPEEFKRLDAYKMGSYFLICAFIGWIWETADVWIVTGKLTDRGFLFIMHQFVQYLPFLENRGLLSELYLVWGLPIIPIYGIGGMAICSLFKRWEQHPLILFFIGLISLTGLELLSSYLCGWILKRQYWDYSGQFLNFEGRICFSSAMAWGSLCVIGTKLFAPRIDNLYIHIKSQRYFKIIVLILILYAAMCALVKYFIDPSIIPN